ncbi:polysaccharide deacetylase [Paenibacillus wynnii]|uniref:polysaccharide deacetylase n=1 Tax=Paenibacillus wynnii TaxID=268407 RepID=UPI00068D6020|nr:polysaccharide deacetylase [Paenibacillus wynnii]
MRDNKKARSLGLVLRGLLLMIAVMMVISGCGTSQAASIRTTKLQEKSPVHARQIVPATIKYSSAAQQPNTPQVSPTPAVASKDNESRKIVYLTFDDGPSPVTAKVLDILKREGVKATFFVLGNGAKSHPEVISDIWEQGHAIGNHSYDHNYHELYSGFTRFWNQIKKTEEIIRGITGTRPQLIRAPGGTFGHFDDTYFYLLKQAGYIVTDWTVDSGDSKRRGVPAAEIIKDAVPNTTSSRVILLMHDGGGHEESAKALPQIIARYKEAGYTFGVLDNQVKPVQFRVSSSNAGSEGAKPSAAWIASNITANSALFAVGKPLVLEVGKQETKLKPGEYRIEQGQYMVPMRAVIERLGGTANWEAGIRSGKATLNGRSFLADVNNKELTFNGVNGEVSVRKGKVEMIGGVIWISLRDLLEIVEHPPLATTVTSDERRVKAD